MARFNFIAFSNAVAGREAEFNDWYDNVHIKDVAAIPGVKSARRLKLLDTQVDEAARKYRYAAIYEIEVPDFKEFLTEMLARSQDGRLRRSSALDPGALPVFWQVL